VAKMSIFRPKKNHLFDAAIFKINSLNDFFTSEERPELQQNRFMQIIPNNPKSPLIMGLGDKKHLIYYPSFSAPYIHQYETSIKNVEILGGTIKDKITGKIYKEGDKFTLYPEDVIEPYTLESECYVKVTVDHIDSIWKNKCR
jgi:hypothetical protein